MFKNSKDKKLFIISILLLFLFIIFFATDAINSMKYNIIDFDGAYNATVAANMARYGKYMVSYPDNIIFYNIITTGPTVLLPTALLYYLFGISNLTTVIIPLIYSIFDIILIFIILYKCLKKIKYNALLATIFTILLCLSDKIYIYISCHLIGESAALFFFLLTMLFLIMFTDKINNKYLFLAGGFLACSFLTKSSMIFIVVSLIGLLYIEWLFQKIKFRHLLSFCLGFLSFFCFIELFKLIQLGNISEYLNYWSNEWKNMLTQSSGINLKINFIDKFNYLEEIFGITSIVSLLITLLPLVSYIYIFIKRIFNKQVKLSSSFNSLLFISVASSSLIIYFLLLGGNGLMYARRHIVNSFTLKLVIIIGIIKFIYNKKIKFNKFISIVYLVSLLLILPFHTIKENFKNMYEKETEDTYKLTLMNNLEKTIEKLGDDIVIYTAGWWQEPSMHLSFPNLKMIDIYSNRYNVNNKTDNDYFLVGHAINDVNISDIESFFEAKLIKVNNNHIDYKKNIDDYNREDFDLYSLYKIKRN